MMTESDNDKLELIRASLKICPDFPKKDIQFIDIFGIFVNPVTHRALIDIAVNRVKRMNSKVEAVVGLEARGFVFGPQIALELQVSFLPIRKKGKLPGKTVRCDYDLEYGKDAIEMQRDILSPGTKVLLLDDLLATGGTLGAAQKLCAELGYEVVETLVIIELLGLGGRGKLADANHVTALFQRSQDGIELIPVKQNL